MGLSRRSFLKGAGAAAGAGALSFGALKAWQAVTSRARTPGVQAMKRFNKVLVIGMDGLDPRIVSDLRAEGAVPAFDRLHGGDKYVEERDIWSNPAEFGGGIYGGFVNVGDPEIVTPFKEIFQIIREGATPTDGVVRGAVEIDIPRQNPRLECLCAALYLKNVHDVSGAIDLSNDEIIKRVFMPNAG